MSDIFTIGKNLLTQDNRITESPVFLVQQKIRRFTDSEDNDYYWVDGDWNEVEDPALIAYLEKTQDAISPDRRYADYSKQHYNNGFVFVQPFFTEAGAKRYIEINGHNLNEPRIYVECGYRNEEWETVREHLMKKTPNHG